MLVRILSRSLKSHKRLVVPQLGAFLVKEPGRSVVFTELLKRDDGVLRGILLGDGLGELEAAGEIDRFVFEVRHAVGQGGEYLLPGLGTMRPGPNGTIAFRFDPAAGAEECAVQPSGEAAEAAEAAAAARETVPEDSAPAVPNSGPRGPETQEMPETQETLGMPDTPGASGTPRGAEPREPELREPELRSTGKPEPDPSKVESPDPAAPAAGVAAGLSGPDCAAPSPSASGSAASAAPHRDASSGPETVRPGRLPEAVRAAFGEAPMSASAKMAPDPSVRGLRYGKPRKSTDAYTYVDRPPRRRGDRFLWIALFAAVLALGAIAFGFLRERQERRAEAEFFEQVGMPLQSAPGDGGLQTE